MTILADQLQIWGIEEGKIIFSDGSLGLGLKLTGIDADRPGVFVPTTEFGIT